ncbi:MAG: tetratricopeptide repeat protein [Nostocaceae cyanobacterium]|nr:tetratricopeptide repeat protein [Nostocaceae cyanobacterium]
MDNNLAIVYLSIFVGLLAIAGASVFRQILKTRRVESAITRLRDKLTKDQGTSQEYYELASIYSDKKLFSQAVKLFQKAIKAAEQEEEENISVIYNGLGYAYFAQEQYDIAIRQYKEALKSNPNYVTALNNLGHAYEQKNLTVPALQAYEQALLSEPTNKTAQRRAESLRKRLVPSA